MTSSAVLEPNLPASSAPPADRPREFQLLLLCARRSLDAAALAELRALSDQQIDWSSVIEAGYWHHIMPLLHKHLGTALADRLPASTADTLKKACDENAQRAQRLAEELSRILQEFKTAGIAVLPFKGPALALTTFDDLTARHITNLDILVQRKNVDKARQLLLAHGYQPVPTSELMPDDAFLHLESKLTFRHVATGTPLDLHHQVVPHRYFYALQVGRLLDRARSFKAGADTWPVLSPEDTLIVLCLHAIKGGFWPALKPVCDVAEVIKASRDLRWQVLMSECARLKCERPVQVGLLLAHDLLGAEIPPEVLASIHRDPTSQQIADFVKARLERRRRGFPNLLAATRVHLRLKKGLWRKARYLLCISTTPSERDFQFLGMKVSLWQSYPIRLLKFGGKFVGQLANGLLTRARSHS